MWNRPSLLRYLSAMARPRFSSPVAVVASLALALSAFAPVPAPCASEEAPAPTGMPCHGDPGDLPVEPEVPLSPAPPPGPASVMTCCSGIAATVAPLVRTDVDLDAVATVALPTLVRPPAARTLLPAPSASPPRGHPLPLSVLYGCFLT